MKLLLIGLALMAFVGVTDLAGPVHARADSPNPWVGTWHAIHPSPAIPDSTMRIHRLGGSYLVSIQDAQDHLFCSGESVVAVGLGWVTDPTHMTVHFVFRCAGSPTVGHQPVVLLLNLGNPNGILEIADSSGHVWTRTP